MLPAPRGYNTLQLINHLNSTFTRHGTPQTMVSGPSFRHHHCTIDKKIHFNHVTSSPKLMENHKAKYTQYQRTSIAQKIHKWLYCNGGNNSAHNYTNFGLKRTFMDMYPLFSEHYKQSGKKITPPPTTCWKFDKKWPLTNDPVTSATTEYEEDIAIQPIQKTQNEAYGKYLGHGYRMTQSLA